MRPNTEVNHAIDCGPRAYARRRIWMVELCVYGSLVNPSQHVLTITIMDNRPHYNKLDSLGIWYPKSTDGSEKGKNQLQSMSHHTPFLNCHY